MFPSRSRHNLDDNPANNGAINQEQRVEACKSTAVPAIAVAPSWPKRGRRGRCGEQHGVDEDTVLRIMVVHAADLDDFLMRKRYVPAGEERGFVIDSSLALMSDSAPIA